MEIDLDEYKANATLRFELIDQINELLEPDDKRRPMMRESATEILNTARAEYQAGEISIEALKHEIQLWSMYH